MDEEDHWETEGEWLESCGLIETGDCCSRNSLLHASEVVGGLAEVGELLVALESEIETFHFETKDNAPHCCCPVNSEVAADDFLESAARGIDHLHALDPFWTVTECHSLAIM